MRLGLATRGARHRRALDFWLFDGNYTLCYGWIRNDGTIGGP